MAVPVPDELTNSTERGVDGTPFPLEYLMKRKWRLSEKKLKSGKNMEFLGRYECVGELPKGWRSFRDDYRHRDGLTLSRTTTVYDEGKMYVNWTCEELGGGNAGIGYWLKMAAARRAMRPQK